MDSATADVVLTNAQLNPTHANFARLLELCSRDVFQRQIDNVRNKLRPNTFRRPVTLVGGPAFQNEELPQNTFGATIVGDYGHIFNPQTREDRARIVRDAYIPSLRQQRYVEPIDRLVRNAVAPTAAKIKPLENSAKPTEITSALRDRQKLENQILLLIGSVGAGKSTFVDYLSLVALPPEIRNRTVWVRLNLNEAPLSPQTAYDWVGNAIVEQLRLNFSDTDFDRFETLQKIFHPELSALRKGPLAVLDPDSAEYKTRIADRLTELQSAPLVLAKGMANFVCAGPNSLLVVALDNCDKRTRDEQLLMFQLAQWLQAEFRCLVVLPLRDVTYDMHRHDPPLDTALKQFVFRIEPPPFSDVLQARVRLALDEIRASSPTTSALSYQLPNGMKVTYPAEDQALYLASLLRSLYAHDRFVRQVMTGLAGRDVRMALQIFLDFCMSGHIGEDEILKIRMLQGRHVLPLSIVARVLMRMHRRFYDGNRSYLKNIIQCDPKDPLPDHFVRLAVLHWFEKRLKVKGPAGVEGFHRVSNMISDLAAIGHDAVRIRSDLAYLSTEGCVIPEHLRADQIEDTDLAKISAAGVVHLQLLANPEYLAACAEDTWISDEALGKRIAERIGAGFESQFSPTNTARNATELVTYLKERWGRALSAPDVFLEAGSATEMQLLREAEAGVSAAEITLVKRLFVGGLDPLTTEAELVTVLSTNGVTPKAIVFPTKAGQSKGFAFFETSRASDTLRALDLDRKLTLRGRRLGINEAHPLAEDHYKPSSTDRATAPLSARIYASQFPESTRASDVRELLAELDLTAVEIVLITDKQTHRFKGATFIELSSLDDAAKAIGSINGLDYKGRVLVARPADPRRKTNRKPSRPNK